MTQSAPKYDYRYFTIDKSGGDPRMQLFQVHERQCMDVGREHEQWEDMREIEFVDMRSYEAAEIDLWLNERGFQHKEMYRTV